MLALYSPQPRPLVLDGRLHAGRPGTIGDLFTLADVAAALAGDPLEGLDPTSGESLRAVATAARAWPGDWAVALTVAAGELAVLDAVLQGSGLDMADLEALHARMTPDEWESVSDCFWRPDPATKAYARIDRFLGLGASAAGSGAVEEVTWETAIAETAAVHGWDQTLAMPLPLFRLLRTGGERQIVPPDATAAAQKARRAFWKGERD